jgi:hypothetical protein
MDGKMMKQILNGMANLTDKPITDLSKVQLLFPILATSFVVTPTPRRIIFASVCFSPAFTRAVIFIIIFQSKRNNFKYSSTVVTSIINGNTFMCIPTFTRAETLRTVDFRFKTRLAILTYNFLNNRVHPEFMAFRRAKHYLMFRFASLSLKWFDALRANQCESFHLCNV